MSWYQIDCDQCKDSGLIYMQEDDNSPVVFMRCSCPYGERHSEKLPRWNKQCDQIFKKLEFRTKEWVPSSYNGTIGQLVEIWKAKTKFSQEYWAARITKA